MYKVDYCLETILNPVLRISFNSDRVETFPLLVLMKPGLSLVSSIKWGYTVPSREHSIKRLGETHLKMTKGPQYIEIIFLLPLCKRDPLG